MSVRSTLGQYGSPGFALVGSDLPEAICLRRRVGSGGDTAKRFVLRLPDQHPLHKLEGQVFGRRSIKGRAPAVPDTVPDRRRRSLKSRSRLLPFDSRSLLALPFYNSVDGSVGCLCTRHRASGLALRRYSCPRRVRLPAKGLLKLRDSHPRLPREQLVQLHLAGWSACIPFRGVRLLRCYV